MRTQLVVQDLAVRRGERAIFAGLSFAVPPGEALILTGPNGAGKTTLLRTIAGFLPPAAGRLELEAGDPDRTIAEQCHYVGHRNAIKPSLTVLENIAFWHQFLADGGSGRVRGHAGAALDTFGLLGLSHIPAGYLSDGQKRRLCLARLLLTPRPLWLLDEPTAALDAASQGLLEAVIDRHLRSGGLAIVATHQPIDLSPQRELSLDAGAEDA
jgi:heme exporter protein A